MNSEDTTPISVARLDHAARYVAISRPGHAGDPPYSVIVHLHVLGRKGPARPLPHDTNHVAQPP